MSVSPAQQTVCADLLSNATGLYCHAEAVLLIESVTALVAGGERGSDVLRWLSLLPRARGKQALLLAADPEQLSLRDPLDDLHPSVRHALRPVRGEDKTRSVSRLLEPDAHGDQTRLCAVCDAEFLATSTPLGGRRPTKCPTHRRKAAS